MLSIIGSKTVEFFVEKALERFFQFIPILKKDGIILEKSDIPKILQNHYTEVINWSFDIPFIGLSQRKHVEESTIELNISSRISKYGKDKNETYFSEKDILNANRNIIILGKPGAGKQQL
ncbi:hypothetical protein [Spirosoma luteum]|uniref:hypothetical protein n=1 Tax=Spirosoma luteum TaxID=431553 RepID=UPI0003716918|nr:hypothetical protein [Spirosoma luteum]